MKRVLLITISLLFGVCLTAQGDSTAQVMEEEEWVYMEEEIVEENDWVEYVGGFDFREGVYRTWREFRLNAPSLPLASLVDSEGQPIKDLRDFDGRIFLRDSTGERSRVPMGRVWGYCADDAVFMDTRNGFQRILRMGSACHMMVQEWEVGGGAIVRGAPVLIEHRHGGLPHDALGVGTDDATQASGPMRSHHDQIRLLKAFLLEDLI